MSSSLQSINVRKLLINFIIELAIYGALLTLYYFLVLRYLSNPLDFLFEQRIVIYAIVSLILIVVQGVFLENVTHFLLNRIGLDRIK